MTTTSPKHHQVGSHQVLVDRDDVDDLLRVVDRVEDWLRHAGHDTVEDLATFLNRPGNGQLAAAGLIELLGVHGAALHRQLNGTTR